MGNGSNLAMRQSIKSNLDRLRELLPESKAVKADAERIHELSLQTQDRSLLRGLNSALLRVESDATRFMASTTNNVQLEGGLSGRLKGVEGTLAGQISKGKSTDSFARKSGNNSKNGNHGRGAHPKDIFTKYEERGQ